MEFSKLFKTSSHQPIDLYNLKHLVLHGIPDRPSHIRPFVWDLLLGLSQPNSSSKSIHQRRHDYHELMTYFTLQLHPSLSDQSSVSSAIRQTLCWIKADVNRTQSDLQFFSTPFRLPPHSSSVTKLNLFINHLNQTQLSPGPHPHSSSSPSSHSPSPSSSASSSSYYSSKTNSPSTISPSSSTTDRTKSPPSSSLFPTSFQSPSHLSQTPKIHPINTLLEASSPSTPRLSLQAPSPINSPGEHVDSNISFTYRDLLSRLLAVWSTLNPGIGYVQGMNEIAAVLVYVYSHHQPHPSSHQVQESGLDDEETDAFYENMEADAFWAFTALVSNLRELFVNSLDGTPTEVESGFGKIFHQYAQQLDWLDPDLSVHLHQLGVEGKFYVLNWLGCLFTRCFELPDLLKLWDSLLALNLDTHQASVPNSSSVPSINNDEGLIGSLIDICCALTVKLGPVLKEHDCFDSIMRVLQTVRVQGLLVEDVIDQVLVIRQRRLALGLDQQQHQTSPPLPISPPDVNQSSEAREWEEDEISSNDSTPALLGPSSWPGLSRLKNLAVDVTQIIPSSPNTPVDHSQISPDQTRSSGIFQKLKHTTDGWRDSDVAAEFSKKATNWTIRASSWGTQALITKITASNQHPTKEPSPTPPGFSPTNRRPMHPYDINLNTTQLSSAASSPQASSSRWSKTSYASNSSFDQPFHPPVSSRSGSPSSSSTLGSPINANHQLAGIGHGPRPLLLSARARTNVVTTPENGGIVNASIKRLSALKLGMTFTQADHQLDSSEQNLHILPTNRTSSNVKLTYGSTTGLDHPSSPSPTQESTTVNILSRGRARSVFSSPVHDRHTINLNNKNERVSLPNVIYVPHSNNGLIEEVHVAAKLQKDERIHLPQQSHMESHQPISNLKEAARSERSDDDPLQDAVDEYVSLYGD